MKVAVVVLMFELLPFSVLVSVVYGCSLSRRSRFVAAVAAAALALLNVTVSFSQA